jgi:DNA-binding transcriptional regulator of glucitol operon
MPGGLALTTTGHLRARAGSVDGVRRRLLTPRWLLGLLLTIAGAGAMLQLGRWQLGRGEQTNSIQNYAYAVEWVMFAAFAVFCFYKLARDADRPPEEPPVTDDVVLPPQRPAVVEPEDDELAAYNAYLARLDERSR